MNGSQQKPKQSHEKDFLKIHRYDKNGVECTAAYFRRYDGDFIKEGCIKVKMIPKKSAAQCVSSESTVSDMGTRKIAGKVPSSVGKASSASKLKRVESDDLDPPSAYFWDWVLPAEPYAGANMSSSDEDTGYEPVDYSQESSRLRLAIGRRRSRSHQFSLPLIERPVYVLDRRGRMVKRGAFMPTTSCDTFKDLPVCRSISETQFVSPAHSSAISGYESDNDTSENYIDNMPKRVLSGPKRRQATRIGLPAGTVRAKSRRQRRNRLRRIRRKRRLGRDLRREVASQKDKVIYTENKEETQREVTPENVTRTYKKVTSTRLEQCGADAKLGKANLSQRLSNRAGSDRSRTMKQVGTQAGGERTREGVVIPHKRLVIRCSHSHLPVVASDKPVDGSVRKVCSSISRPSSTSTPGTSVGTFLTPKTSGSLPSSPTSGIIKPASIRRVHSRHKARRSRKGRRAPASARDPDYYTVRTTEHLPPSPRFAFVSKEKLVVPFEWQRIKDRPSAHGKQGSATGQPVIKDADSLSIEPSSEVPPSPTPFYQVLSDTGETITLSVDDNSAALGHPRKAFRFTKTIPVVRGDAETPSAAAHSSSAIIRVNKQPDKGTRSGKIFVFVDAPKPETPTSDATKPTASELVSSIASASCVDGGGYASPKSTTGPSVELAIPTIETNGASGWATVPGTPAVMRVEDEEVEEDDKQGHVDSEEHPSGLIRLSREQDETDDLTTERATMQAITALRNLIELSRGEVSHTESGKLIQGANANDDDQDEVETSRDVSTRFDADKEIGTDGEINDSPEPKEVSKFRTKVAGVCGTPDQRDSRLVGTRVEILPGEAKSGGTKLAHATSSHLKVRIKDDTSPFVLFSFADANEGVTPGRTQSSRTTTRSSWPGAGRPLLPINAASCPEVSRGKIIISGSGEAAQPPKVERLTSGGSPVQPVTTWLEQCGLVNGSCEKEPMVSELRCGNDAKTSYHSFPHAVDSCYCHPKCTNATVLSTGGTRPRQSEEVTANTSYSIWSYRSANDFNTFLSNRFTSMVYELQPITTCEVRINQCHVCNKLTFNSPDRCAFCNFIVLCSVRCIVCVTIGTAVVYYLLRPWSIH